MTRRAGIPAIDTKGGKEQTFSDPSQIEVQEASRCRVSLRKPELPNSQSGSANLRRLYAKAKMPFEVTPFVPFLTRYQNGGY